MLVEHNEHLQKLKSATAGIGVLIKDENTEIVVVGTGFFVSPKGYLMTANHVIDGCYAPLQEALKQKRDANLAAIWLNKSSSADTFELKMIPLNPPYRVRLGSIEKSKQERN